MENWIVKIADVGYKFEKDVYIYYKSFNGKVNILYGDTIKEVDPASQVKPTLSLPPEALQKLANVLSIMGIKPDEGFLEGKLQATEKHLEDMRKLVFEYPIEVNGQQNDKTTDN